MNRFLNKAPYFLHIASDLTSTPCSTNSFYVPNLEEFHTLGCFGGEIETPVLDSLAEGGVRLTQFYHNGGPERTLFFEHQGHRTVREGNWSPSMTSRGNSTISASIAPN